MAVAHSKFRKQKGYLLLSVMLLMTLMLIALSVELPRISQQIKRNKEEELIHRGEEYARAVRKFYRKFGRYPLSIDQLENTNNMRFLRRRFKDPMTGKDDWRIVHQGEIVPLPGTGISKDRVSTDLSSKDPGSKDPGSKDPPSKDSPPKDPGGATPDAAGNSGSAFGNPQSGGGPMAGVASIKKDLAIKIRKEKDHYNEWLFYYDPAQEQLGGDMKQIVPPPQQKPNTN
jgi:type II secretory pathway pseudopilin PulG